MFREFLADFDGTCLAPGVEPVGNPIDRAEYGKCGQFGIRWPEDPGFDSILNHTADAPVKTVSFCNDLAASGSGECLNIHGQGRAAQFVNHHMNEGYDDAPQPFLRRKRTLFDPFEHFQEQVQRVFVTSKQDGLLISEVVVKIAFGHVERAGDFIDTRPVIASMAKRRGGTLKNLYAHVAILVVSNGHCENNVWNYENPRMQS